MAKIVLAHGLLGFAKAAAGTVSYFNGVQDAYTQLGHQVMASPVDAVGSIERRSTQLAKAIEDEWPGIDDPIYMIGHSMGGLDCRRVIAKHAVGKRVKRLITICTPHYGSPVADAVLDVGNPLHLAVPELLKIALRSDLEALSDLRERQVLQDADVATVEYLNVGAVAPSTFPPSWLFGFSQLLLDKFREDNDGVVTLKSAAGGRALLEVWPVDHAGAIGWPTDLSGAAAAFGPSQAHIDRYVDLLRTLITPWPPESRTS